MFIASAYPLQVAPCLLPHEDFIHRESSYYAGCNLLPVQKKQGIG